MAQIDIAGEGPTFTVTITEGSTSSRHRVTVPSDFAPARLFSTNEAFVAASIRFLLDREPKEAIMREFDVAIINRYFPEYPDELDSP